MRRARLTVVAALALWGGPAAAQRSGTVEVGGLLNVTRFDPSLRFGEGLGGGALAGVFFAPGLALELSATRVATGAAPAQTPLHARALYASAVAERVAMLFGVGYVHNLYDGSPIAWENGISGLLGVRTDLSPRLAARVAGVADYYPSPLNTSATVGDNWNFTIQAGLVGRLSVRSARASDRDRDGVIDRLDACPGTTSGEAIDSRGCPLPRDGDGDGVVDTADRCPQSAPGEMVDSLGCTRPSDTDGDGVDDPIDRCPDSPAAQNVDATGCPLDSDRDGVLDTADRCPLTPVGERVDGTGCTPPQDTDRDGVLDPADKCPGTAAGQRVDATGCAPLFTGVQRTLLLTGVNFETGSATLLGVARTILDRVAESLVAHAGLRVEVAGHTDSRGSAAANRRLSQARADAVREYLIERGVAAERLTARGYGSDNPIDANTTALGRSRNRRVELHRRN